MNQVVALIELRKNKWGVSNLDNVNFFKFIKVRLS